LASSPGISPELGPALLAWAGVRSSLPPQMQLTSLGVCGNVWRFGLRLDVLIRDRSSSPKQSASDGHYGQTHRDWPDPRYCFTRGFVRSVT